SCWFDRRRTRIAGDLNITIAQQNLKPLQLQRIFDRLYARASNRRWRILATDNYWRNEKCKLVNQPRLHEQAGERWATFQQHPLNRPFAQFVENAAKVYRRTLHDHFHAARLERIQACFVSVTARKNNQGGFGGCLSQL